MNSKKHIQDDRYKNPDNDPRGPYLLVDVTASFDRPSLKYEWHGQFPPEGRSWRFSKERAEELERDGRIVFLSLGRPRLKRYLQESRRKLSDLLHGLPNETPDNESDFMRKIIPRLVQILDYAESETFYDYGGKRIRADVVLSSSIESKHWIVLARIS
jgi:hypothetical protein